MIKVRRKKRNKMRKILYMIFFLSLSIDNIAFAESKLEKIKNKIKSAENKLIGKVWGDIDCSQYSTKTFKGLSDYNKCKKGLDPSEEKSIFLLKKSKKNKKYDPNKPCDEYSAKTFTGLAAKMKCKRAKKN
tara:strand:- start:67 stop:459 length:393 start_codon:yes stop_codon:yes gene_type:complete